MSPEVMDRLFTRDYQGYRLLVMCGEPDSEGFYTPTITTDYTDRAGDGLRVHSAWVPAETSDLEWECVTDTGESCGGEHDDLVSLADVKRALGLSGPA